MEKGIASVGNFCRSSAVADLTLTVQAPLLVFVFDHKLRQIAVQTTQIVWPRSPHPASVWSCPGFLDAVLHTER
jgi:hypothetical protein